MKKTYNYSDKKKALESNQKRWGHKFYHFAIKQGKVSFTYKKKAHTYASIDEAFDMIRALIA